MIVMIYISLYMHVHDAKWEKFTKMSRKRKL